MGPPCDDRAVRLPSLLPFLALVVACGDDGGTPMDADAAVRLDVMESRPGCTPMAPATECVVTTWSEPAGARDHRDPCSEITYPSTPPASGPHFGVWADFLVYDDEVPWGFLVHSLEHGAIVLGYDCPDGCPDVLEAFATVVESHGSDPLCDGHPSADARFIVTPMSGLEAPVIALAWEHAYTATGVDESSLAEFVELHYGMAPEDLCVPGRAQLDGEWCP